MFQAETPLHSPATLLNSPVRVLTPVTRPVKMGLLAEGPAVSTLMDLPSFVSSPSFQKQTRGENYSIRHNFTKNTIHYCALCIGLPVIPPETRRLQVTSLRSGSALTSDHGREKVNCQLLTLSHHPRGGSSKRPAKGGKEMGGMVRGRRKYLHSIKDL